MHKFLYSHNVTVLYVFRAILCSSSGGQIVCIQHMVSSLSVSDRGGRAVHRLRENSLSTCCSRSFSIVIRFAGFCYGRFMAMRYKFNLVTYVQRPLVIGRRGGTKRNLNEITDAGSRGRKAVAYERDVSECQWHCLLNGTWFALTLYSASFLCIDIKLVNRGKEIIKTVCYSVNRTRFPKQDHLPDWVCRDKHDNKGDLV